MCVRACASVCMLIVLTIELCLPLNNFEDVHLFIKVYESSMKAPRKYLIKIHFRY